MHLEVDGNRIYAKYPLDVREEISKTFEDFFKYLSTFKGRLERKGDANNTIENFITSTIFQNHLTNDTMEEWIDIAKKVDLSDTNLTTEDPKGKDLITLITDKNPLPFQVGMV